MKGLFAIRKIPIPFKILIFCVILIVVFIRTMDDVFYRYTIDDYSELRSELIVENPDLQAFPEDIPSSAVNIKFYNNVGSDYDRLSFGIGYCLPAEEFRLRLNTIEKSYREASKLDPARSILFRKFPKKDKGVDQDFPTDARIFLVSSVGGREADTNYSQKCVIVTSEASHCILYYLASW